MDNFEITVMKKEKENILIFMKTSEPPFDFLEEMETALTDIHYKGNVVIDELLHSGNNDERFITGYFDGNRFESGEFNFKLVMKKSELREPVCRFLQKDKEFLFLTGLTGKQQKLIEKGCVI